jgi:glycosyltransferase involved in cell wall biosynthesis
MPGLSIVHVVSLVSPAGEYGGPARVALNQSRALAEAGHEPMVAAGSRGFATAPDTLNGVPVKLFPVHRALPGTGFAGIFSSGMLRWLRSAAPTSDVLHIHLARDLVTMPAALLAQRLGVPYVVQTHGMIDASNKVLARLLDAMATRRVLGSASAVFHLTDRERSDLQGVAGAAQRFVELRNGIGAEPLVDSPPALPDACTDVLFLARLHRRKRPMDFVDAAAELLPQHPNVTFRLVGPDEGEGTRVASAIDRIGSPRLRWDGPSPMERTAALMSRAAVYVLPSVDEPYPMTVLEAMSCGRPVVVTDSCGLAPLIAQSGSGLVTASGAASVAAAVSRLLADPQLRREMGQTARLTAQHELDMDVVTKTLLSAYEEARPRKKWSLQ